MKNDYFLGLDIGTNSVGWAVTDNQYQLCKSHGKELWGVRLFEEANPAQKRRVFRSARRRLQRRKQRIQLVQDFFKEEISAVDTGFYQRLWDSKFWKEDKEVMQGNTLFFDKDYSDKEYHKEFPTIYHLRKALMEEKREFDVRLVYLAIHHIIKHRGHFLFEGQDIKSVAEFRPVFTSFCEKVGDSLAIDLDITKIDKVETLLKDKTQTKSDKSKELNRLFDAGKQEKELFKLLIGLKAKFSDLFDDENLKDAEEKGVSFSDSGFEEKEDQYRVILEDNFSIIQEAKAIYDWILLADILDGEKSLSSAKIKVYEAHKEDLKLLKKVIKEYFPDRYKEVFMASDFKNDLKNYAAYIGTSEAKKKSSKDDFYKYLRKILEPKKSVADIAEILSKIEKGNFLPKQVNSDNGVIPKQLHQRELESILKNVSSYLNFLNEKDSYGTVLEKIVAIFNFRIPYYVGPLNDSHKKEDEKLKQCWLVKRQSNVPIRPWNFEEVVDLDKSAEVFIKRMTNKCTYLIGKDVLTKNSLLYSEYTVLNELNNLKINGEPITVVLKNRIFEELFKKYKKVTQKRLKSFLKIDTGLQDFEITGIDGDFKSSLTSYIDFKNFLETKRLTEEDVELIISWIVLFGDDKNILKRKIEDKFSFLTNDEKKEILNKRYSGWGRFSREFLTKICAVVDKQSGISLSIISAMRQTNFNLMELLSKQFHFLDTINSFNEEFLDINENLTYKMVDDLYVSPSVKRQIWQTLTIVKELKKVMGSTPKKIFVEMARSKEENKRTESRRKKLIDLYRSCKNDERDWIGELEGLDDSRLRDNKLYLYYTQMGKCMYSGKRIELSDLYRNYDRDHIFPQSKTIDDSITNNLVLAEKILNAKKTDEYPISPEIQAKQLSFWTILLKNGFITKTKFERLTRTTPLSLDELSNFISRQLVETRQTSKAVAEILKKQFKDSSIVYVKATLTSRFRKEFDLLKVREINDHHHAQDAYLNIVVGNVYDTKFTKDPINFVKNAPPRSYSLNKMFTYDVIRGESAAWITEDGLSIGTVKKIMKKHNILFTRYAFEGGGGFFKQNLLKKGLGQAPIKNGEEDRRIADIDKYGGYDKITSSYFFLVEHTTKKGRVKTIEYVPVLQKDRIEREKSGLITYCSIDLKLGEPKILLPKIKINTLFVIDGFRMHLSGRTGKQLIYKGANQLILDSSTGEKFRRVLAILFKMKEDGSIKINERDGVITETNVELYQILLEKLKNTIYAKKLSAQIQTLEKGLEKFIPLSPEKQCIVLNEVLHLFQCNPVCANLKLLGAGDSCGRLYSSMDITNLSSCYIINQSPTGIFEQKINLSSL